MAAAQSDLSFQFEGVGGATFDVVRFELIEGLSQPFRLELELSSPEPNVELDALLDSEVTFTIARDGEPVRTVHGIVTMFEQSETGFRRTRYSASVEPTLARLGFWHGSRIHQQLSVPDILKLRLKERGLHARFNVSRPHETREYCTQYREADLAHFARLAAEEGIVYYFDPRHRSELVLTDALPSGPALPGADDIGAVIYQALPGGTAVEPRLWHFALRQQLAPASAVQRDHTFRNPRYSLEHRSDARDAVGRYEHYDYPGRFKRDESGRPFTATKLRALRSDALVATLEGDDARLWPGLNFLLEDHPSEPLNRDWRVVAMHHVGEQSVSQEEDGANGEHGTRYSYTARAVPGDMEWRPKPLPRPVIDGPQIAHVVGPPGEEIFPDEHARVKVHFPWDRQGTRQENDSCWIRVAQGWAGPMYGFMAIPRVGMEVIVSFLDGDPDQPCVTSCAFNAENRPPYPLPQHKARTVFRTNTHKGKGYNELRFEDEAGQEEIFVHAQKDRNIVVGNDETTRVGHDRSEDVGNDETIQIGHDRKETVGNDETLGIGQDRRETIGRDHTLEIGRTRQVTIGKDLIEDVGNTRTETTAADRKVETGGHYEHNVAGKHDIEAGERITQRTRQYALAAAGSLTIRGPGGTIRIDRNGVTLEGVQIQLKGQIKADAEGLGNDFSIHGVPALAEVIDRRYWIGLHYLDQETGEPIDGADYEIHFKDGSMLEGTLDAQGQARHDDIDPKRVEKVLYKPRKANDEPAIPQLEDLARTKSGGGR
ncbi:type VI secretion system Vgr family protein [Lysobacter changpingensis]|uniref:type VI secretion system Vgr family protein n=1 Tax=Lysobacter changpingensis TaxID=2792784 RepID=UPI001A8DECFA|nr:type VI secretion system tip protein TssI/VgrG [Lysobacter changpingensis]